MKYAIFIIIIFLEISCRKIYYYPDRDLGTPEPAFIAHAGGGICNYEPNSFEAVVFGSAAYDGIELDIQLSKNGTIWLGHDPELKACNSHGVKCFRASTDSYIENLDSCLGPNKDYTRLAEVFEYMTKNYPEKPISLDVKAWVPCGVSDLNILRELNKLADAIIVLKNKYKPTHLMVESETAQFLNYLKDNSSGIECYLSTWGDFERGMLITLKRKLDGISFKYKYKEEITADHVRLIHRKGLKIQLWVVDDSTDMKEAISINPDYIQTDILQN
jgi:glycerophosphoryl diester phosphodiesterase